MTEEAVRRASSEIARRRSSHSAAPAPSADAVSAVKSDPTVAGGTQLPGALPPDLPGEGRCTGLGRGYIGI